ncbi:multidrug ABC transporter [Ligilactobacillus ceti DSM 22408]|uniref:Multidrug ABC transporter n=2 Tax=Ligilactobacillus TaxID=2767887 RepID=A0A0R2KW68_9LACO|nr:multidrug ABC transporter [Ligilactobacillus ceti DSM 22408]
MLLAILMGVVGHLAATFIPIFGSLAVVKVMGLRGPLTIHVIFILLVILAVVRGILRYAEQAFNHYLAFKILAIIRDRVFKALRRLAPAKLAHKDKGDLISVITSDVELLEVFYAHTVSPICIAGIYTVIMTVFIGHFYWVLGLIALLAYLTIGILVPIIVTKFSHEGLAYRQTTGKMSSFVLDSLRGLSEIIQYDRGVQRLTSMNQQSADLAQYEEKMKLRTGKNIAMTSAIIICFDVLMLLVAARYYLVGTIGFSAVILATVTLMSSFGPVIALANLGSTLENTFAAGNRVLDILDEEPVTKVITNQAEVAYQGAALENISFAYDQEQILHDITMDFDKGKIIGIKGKSGSGKSTILKLLMRFWEVDQGRVAISGRSVNEINTANLREIESFVTQETHLFKDTIYANLKIAKPHATKTEMEQACQKAAVHDLIMSLPKGYETQVGELGDLLSDGEKLRLGVARAFLHDGDLLLLDEPTSNVDSLNEAIILNSINNEKGKRTVILVSHRNSTLRVADRIYELKEERES